ncbi:MAG TPA: MFS transporter [Candidatus Limnocylindrales bacterium]
MHAITIRTPSVTSGLWSQADFRRFWGADVVSKIGDATSVLALPLTAILVLDASPFEVGLIGVAQLAAAVLIGLPAGALVDRIGRRRPVMIGADLGRAIALATIPLAWFLGVVTIAQLLAVAAVNAALAAFFDVASSALVPRLVGRSNLIDANAKLAVGRSAAEVSGPAIAGALISAVGAPLAILFDGVSFVASALMLRRVSVDDSASGGEPDQPMATTMSRPSVRSDVATGLRFVAHQPYVRAVVATAFIANLTRTMAFTVLLIAAVREAGLSPAEIGLAFAIGNVGFFVGGLTARAYTRRLGVGRAMVVSVLCFGPAMTLVAVAPTDMLVYAITGMLFVNGFGIATHSVNQVSLRQAVTPTELLARVAAVTRLVITSALPLGAAIGGTLGSIVGLHETLVVGTVGLYLAALPYLVSPVRSLRSLPSTAGP